MARCTMVDGKLAAMSAGELGNKCMVFRRLEQRQLVANTPDLVVIGRHKWPQSRLFSERQGERETELWNQACEKKSMGLRKK